MVDEEIAKKLIDEAITARNKAYAPYSHFMVGAALMTAEGSIYTGCNIENAAYGPSNCAERTAFFKAISDGKRSFSSIAVVGSPKGHAIIQYASPCGICRQVMTEFCNPESFYIIVAKSEKDYYIKTLKELLPDHFGPDNLDENN